MQNGRPSNEPGPEPIEASIDVYGRDEMNLAEFPIAALTDHVPQGRNTICFGDGSGSLMITGSDAYGLPTPADADVVVALIQLTKRRIGFTTPTVPFTRTEVLAILGWPESGKSYRRLTEFLMRWSMTSLKYEGTWWDRKSRRKINAVFHILNEVVLFDRSDRDEGPGPPPQSYFAWNKIFLNSCQAGNLKRLDLGMYFALEHASSKRLYRFLDKRLHRQPDQTFDLAEVAFERVGLSRGYVGKKGGISIGKVREKLRPAIEELEARGFLIPLTPEDRYRKQDAGWAIRFMRTGGPNPSEAPDGVSEGAIVDLGKTAEPVVPGGEDAAIEALVARGVTRRKAEDLARRHPIPAVVKQVEVFDWKLANDPSGMKKNPAGWLVKAIEDGYPTPLGFRRRADREARLERDREAAEDARRSRTELRRRDGFDKAIDGYIARLSAPERTSLEAEALAGAPDEARRDHDSRGTAPSIRRALLLVLLREHVAAKLERRDGASPGLLLGSRTSD